MAAGSGALRLQAVHDLRSVDLLGAAVLGADPSLEADRRLHFGNRPDLRDRHVLHLPAHRTRGRGFRNPGWAQRHGCLRQVPGHMLGGLRDRALHLLRAAPLPQEDLPTCGQRHLRLPHRRRPLGRWPQVLGRRGLLRGERHVPGRGLRRAPGVHGKRRRGVALRGRALLRPGSERDDLLGLHPGGGFSLHEELLRRPGALLRLLRGGRFLLHRRGWHLSAVCERRQDRASRRLHLPLDDNLQHRLLPSSFHPSAAGLRDHGGGDGR
mmetsp:Transcript_38015/g.77798  ORF Transcript_38015/g.77798 Transcript_38015/m.77798 type:complete len:267 (-) Transcript_38015:1202-2002(-)